MSLLEGFWGAVSTIDMIFVSVEWRYRGNKSRELSEQELMIVKIWPVQRLLVAESSFLSAVTFLYRFEICLCEAGARGKTWQAKVDK